MKRTFFQLAFLLALATFSAIPAAAQRKPDPPKPADQKQASKPDAKTDQKKEEPKKEEPKKDPKVEDYERTVKDLKKTEGAFTLYQRKRDILLELPEDKLGKLFLIQAALETGVNAQGLQAGDPVGIFGVDAFAWKKQDDQMWLTRPNERYRWDKDDPLAVAAQRSFPEAILGSFRIEATHPEKKLILVNITSLFTGDTFRLNEMMASGLGGPYMLDREKTWPEKVKSFPENSVIEMNMHFVSARNGPGEGNPIAELLGLSLPDQLEDSRSAPVKVAFDLWWRKDEYLPRLADPRVGYFTQDFYSVNRFLNEDRTERYIMRFNLKKKDPTATLSDPVKPIVWTVDNSVPPQYRDAVKEGILRWNKAFEAIGYKNAVQVQDQPKDPDYDHADGRYNVVRWTISEDSPYAVSWFRTDPFTGQILNASITFDANMLAFAMHEHDKVAAPGSTAHKITDVLLRDPNRALTDDDWLWAPDREVAKREAFLKMAKAGFSRVECELGTGLADNAKFAYDTLVAGGLRISKEDYAKQFVSDTICHEAGHCLGLRHNFIGSTNLSTNELANDELTSKEGISASVMDYVPVNVMAILKGRGNFYSPTIGTYDKWAIKYGYVDGKSATSLGEKPTLLGIASLSGEHGLAYMGDENANTWDPYVVMFDEGSDPLNYVSNMLEAAHRVRYYAIDQLPRSGESYSERTDLILISIAQSFAQGRIAARFVGGVHGNKNFRNDRNEHDTLAPVNADDQRLAVHLIVRNLLSADSFALSKNVVMNLSVDPNSDLAAVWTAPLRLILGSQQERMVARLMSANTTDLVCENQFKWSDVKGAYTIGEHYGLILSAIFSEVGKNEPIPPVRRDLQRFAVNVLMIQASAPAGAISEDVREIASDSLKRLSKRFSSQLEHATKLDDMSQLHLRDTRDAIDRFLERQYVNVGH